MNTPSKPILTQNLKFRVMTGLPLAAAAICYMFIAPLMVFIAISYIIAILAIWEYCSALRHTNLKFSPIVIYLNALINMAAFASILEGQSTLGLYLLAFNVLVLILASLFRWRSERKLLFWYLLPQIWIVSPIMLIIILRFKIAGDAGSHLILFVLLIAIFNDIFAYFGGKKFGKHLLAPVISPKKTREGSIFGLVGGMVAGFGLAFYYPFYQFNFSSAWIIATTILCLTFASQAGDLLESSFKRYCKIKDSSNLLPGHGGFLDRIDAYLLAIPVFVCILYLLGIPEK
jgi:phosphatidate cytidylyltransferase